MFYLNQNKGINNGKNNSRFNDADKAARKKAAGKGLGLAVKKNVGFKTGSGQSDDVAVDYIEGDKFAKAAEPAKIVNPLPMSEAMMIRLNLSEE